MADKKEIQFVCKIIRNVYDSSNYKVYAVDVDREKYPDVKFTIYNSVSIFGDIQELGIGQPYEVIGLEEYTEKNKYGYRIKHIQREKVHSADDMYIFLHEILTPTQARVLYDVYPDIVQRVLENRLDDIDLNLLSGIKEYTFNVIKNKIIDNYALAELVIEFKGLLSMSVIKKLYEEYPSVQQLKNKLKSSPYKSLTRISRIGFLKADEILLELEKEKIIKFDFELKTSKERCLACIMYALEKNEEDGHTRIEINELRKRCMKQTPACSHFFVEAIKDPQIHYSSKTGMASLTDTFETESYIASKIIDGLYSELKPWNIDTSKYIEVDGITLSDEQQQITKLVCDNQISILNGNGGSGKSFSTQAVINMAKDNNLSYLLISPTGKAAKVLSDFTKEDAKTVHRGLCYNPAEGWGYNEEHQLLVDLVIVDEFSMVDIFLFKHLMESINFNISRLLLIGDSAQLPSVACGNLLHDFLESEIIPTITLTKIFRYGEGGLMKVATDIRKCIEYLGKSIGSFTYFGANKDYAFINVASSAIVKNALALYKKVLSKEFQESHGLELSISDVQVLTSKNIGDCGTVILNNELQKIANKNYGTMNYLKHGETLYYKDDLVMQTSNNYHAELYLGEGVDINIFDQDEIEDPFENETHGFKDKKKNEVFIANGETGVILEVSEKYMIIDFNGTIVKYYKDNLSSLSLGYACTIHRSQGSSIPVVILLTPKSHAFMLNSNLLYVGVSRTKKLCFHLGEAATVNMAVKKKANLQRNTYMQEMLKLYIKLIKQKHITN